LTAAVVALPLSLAFGVASGAGALAGLWGAILAGFLAAIFGGIAGAGVANHIPHAVLAERSHRAPSRTYKLR
jgi:MFS superfamily sulfate permease-like transporter